MNFPADPSHGFDGHQKSNVSFRKTLIENFRDATHGLGNYCAVKNELKIRKGRKVYRFICGKNEIRFAGPALPEVVILLADDATVPELKRFIAKVID